MQEIQALEEADPTLVDELLLKRKWRNVQRDPSRSLKDQSLDTSSYWQQLNNLPQKGIEQIVNDRIVDKDRQSCDFILKNIYEDKEKADAKQGLIQQERQKLRTKLRERHQQVVELEK